MADPNTKHARRVYLGGIARGTTNPELKGWLVEILTNALGADEANRAVLSIHIDSDKMYAFVEFTSIELTTAIFDLDGIKFKNEVIKVRRPKDYRPDLILPHALGPIPDIKADAYGIISTTVQDGPNKIFIGGIPNHVGEESLKEILSA